MEIVRRSFGDDDRQPLGHEVALTVSSLSAAAALVLAGHEIQSIRDVDGDRVVVFNADARSTLRRFSDVKHEIAKLVQPALVRRR